MIQFLAPLALVFCVSDPAAEVPSQPLMAAVPADSIFVVSCDDPATLRANILSHQMVRLFDGGSGAPYVDAVVDLILSEADGENVLSSFELVMDLCEGFDGPVVGFASMNGAGFLTASADGGGSLRAAFDKVMTLLPEAKIENQGTHQGFQLRSIEGGSEGDHGDAVIIRAEASGITGLFIGEGKENVLGISKDSIRRYTAQAKSDISTLLADARLTSGGKGSRSAIDFLLDISQVAPLLEFGYMEDCWLYGRVDTGGPTHAEAVMDLRLPKEGPVANFLDVLTPVTADDLRLIPDYALSFYAARFDLELLLERTVETWGDVAAESLEEMRQASIGATGRDLIDDFVLGFDGYFATYEVEPPTAPYDISSLIAGQGVYIAGVHDAEEMLEVLDDIISVGGMDSMIDFRDYKDVEIWAVEVDPSITPAIAFMEGQLLFSPNVALIERAIDHATTEGSKSIIDGDAGRQLMEYGAGGFIVSHQDTALAAWKILAQGSMISELAPELGFLEGMPQPDLADVKREIKGSTIMAIVRTANGILLRGETR